jgi:hypothetical protein
MTKNHERLPVSYLCGFDPFKEMHTAIDKLSKNRNCKNRPISQKLRGDMIAAARFYHRESMRSEFINDQVRLRAMKRAWLDALTLVATHDRNSSCIII